MQGGGDMIDLTEHLASWRAERPDEWTMDEFIRKALKLEERNDELEAKLKALEHIGSEDDTLVNRLLGVYETNGIKRDFTKDGHFIPAINKEAAHRIKELEARVKYLEDDKSHFRQCFYNAQSLVIRELVSESEQDEAMTNLQNDLKFTTNHNRGY